MSDRQSNQFERAQRPQRHDTALEAGIEDRRAIVRRSRDIVRSNVMGRIPSLLNDIQPVQAPYPEAAIADQRPMPDAYASATGPAAVIEISPAPGRSMQSSAATVLNATAPGIGQQLSQQAYHGAAAFPVDTLAQPVSPGYDSEHTILDEDTLPSSDDDAWMRSLERTPSQESPDAYVTDVQARARVDAAFASQPEGKS